MLKKSLCIIVLLLAFIYMFASCDNNTGTDVGANNSTHTHSYGEWETTKNATCTAEGSKERYCSCGDKQMSSISATGHNFSAWTTVKEATTTEKGREERVCSCGEKETREIDLIPVATTVTKTEWKNAFDFSNTDSLLFTTDELCSEAADNEVYGTRGTLNIQNGVVYQDIVEFWNDEEDIYQGYATGVINNFSDLGDYAGEWLWEFGSELEYDADYGFSWFEYSESSKSYNAAIEIDGILCNVSFEFENKQIKKIAISGRDNEMSLNCTYTFSYN